MTSVSIQYKYASLTRKSVTQCPIMGKLSSISVAASENPPHYKAYQNGEINKYSKHRTRKSHTSAPKNVRRSLCETKADSTLDGTGYGYQHMKMKDELPKGNSINNIMMHEGLSTSYNLRAHRKRGFPDAKRGKRISVLRFKKQKIDEDDVSKVESGTDPNPWARDKDLSPVACSLAHVVPLRDDQRQTEMERQDNIGSPPESDILPPLMHNINFSTLNNVKRSDTRQFNNHQPTSDLYPSNFHKHNDQNMPLHQNNYSLSQKSTFLDYQQRFDSNPYTRDKHKSPNKYDNYSDELERGMQHFLASELEATQDMSHPWHDMMSSTALVRQEASLSFNNGVYQSSSMSLLAASGASFDQLSFNGDNPSLAGFYPAESWGRGDAAPGESSPDSSASDPLSPSHRHYYDSSSPSSTHASARTISSRTSSSFPSTSSEMSVSLEPLPEEGRIMLDAVNGFLLVLDHDARVLYVSENVTEQLGFPQADMMGCDLRDYIHSRDIKELDSHLNDVQFLAGAGPNPPTWMTRRMFYLGMKFSFFRPGTRSKENGYKLVQCNAKLRFSRKRCPVPREGAQKQQGGRKKACSQNRRGRPGRQKGRKDAAQESHQEESSAHGLRVKAMILLCRPVQTESVLEIRPDGNMFISRHDLGFHFIFCDPRVTSLIGYEPSDMLGRTAYQFHSPWDAIICKHCAKQMILAGTATSGYYRFLSRTGAWVWMVTSATIIFDTRRQPQYIVCKNYIVSPILAERDLSRQRRDFDMMKYPGFTLDTNQTLSLTTSNVLADTSPNGDVTSKSYSYGDSMSLVTLDRKLGEVDPNAMLEKLFASEQIDVSNSPFHLARAKRRAARSSRAGSTKGLANDIKHGRGSPFVSKDVASSPMDQAVDSAMGFDIDSQNDSQRCMDFPGNQNVSPQSSYTQDSSIRSSSPMLTSLWHRNEQDSEFMAGDFSSSSESIRMDTSALYDFLTPPTTGSSIGYSISGYDSSTISKNAEDRREFSLGFNPNTLNGEDPELNKNSFPILTTTNMYSLDLAPELSDTLSSDLSSFQNFIDPPQSIPLTSATSFSDGHDFLFPSASRFLDETFPAYDPIVETDNLDRMDTPVCFEADDFEMGDKGMESKSTDITPQGSEIVDSGTFSVNENFSVQGKPINEKERDSSSFNFLNRNLDSREDGPTCDLASNPVKRSPSLSMSHSGKVPADLYNVKQLSHPNNVTILNNTVFQGGKISKTPPGGNEAGSAKSTNQSFNSLNINSSVQNSGGENGNCFQNVAPSPGSSRVLIKTKTKTVQRTDSSSRSGESNIVITLMEENEKSPYKLNSFSLLQKPNSRSLGTHESLDASESPMPTTDRENGHCLSPPILPSPVYGKTETDRQSSQPSPYDDVLSPSSNFSTTHTQSLFDSASSSSDSDTPGRPSLLRTLLDKEGTAMAIQGPITYAEWILHKTLKEKNNTEKSDAFSKIISGKRTVNRKSRIKKGNFKKSTELPLPMSSHGSFVRYGKDILQQRKRTTELPLPSVPLAKSPDSQPHQSRVSIERPSSSFSDGSSSNISTDISLPDDLLDLAVEYCGSMGPEQTDAFLSDFTEISSFEDNLFSLVGSPALNKGQQNQHKADLNKTLSDKQLSTFESQASHSTYSSSQPPDESLQESKRTSVIPNGSKTMLYGNNDHVKNSMDASLTDIQVSKMSSARIGPPARSAPMSLLRAAVTTPDVDKLIEQIPFGKHGHYNLDSSRRSSSGSSENSMMVESFGSNRGEQDIVITKVTGLDSSTEEKASRSSPQGNSPKSSQSIRNGPFSSKSPPADSKLNAIFVDHIYTVSLVNPQPSTPIDTSALSSSNRNTGLKTSKHSAVSLINGNTSVSGKTCYTDTLGRKVLIASSNSPASGKSRHSATSQVKSTTSTISLCPTRSSISEDSNSTSGFYKNDLSSTEPVSVMIMRKEAHRSRRSKSIAVQTDNAPGEVYPEFERSPNDIILYPRCSVSSAAQNGPVLRHNQTTNSMTTSPAMSPVSSAPTHSPQGTSQLERFLRGYQSSGENEAVTSPGESSYSPSPLSSPSGPGTPFLQRLLTGELSRDNYRRLDEQMREDERRQSGSSSSDVELSEHLC